jgi:hypothetical protein
LSFEPFEEDGIDGKLAFGPDTVVLLELVEHSAVASAIFADRYGSSLGWYVARRLPMVGSRAQQRKYAAAKRARAKETRRPRHDGLRAFVMSPTDGCWRLEADLFQQDSCIRSLR